MEQALKVKFTLKCKIAKYNGNYKPGMEPVEIKEFDVELTEEEYLRLQEKRNGPSEPR